MSLLYLTADTIGEQTGGGIVTAMESLAMKEFSNHILRDRKDVTLSSVQVLSRRELGSRGEEPWKWDDVALDRLSRASLYPPRRLCHIYSGTFSKTVKWLKERGTKVVFTIAAHDKEVSRREHEKLGINFAGNYPHLVEKKLWNRYIEGYRLADIIVCPGSVPEQTIRNYGQDFLHKDIRIIPHGCHLPEKMIPLPKTFVVGYCGSFGADKGVRYLLEAWKKLDYRDGSLLVLAGRDSTSPIGKHFLNTYGGGSVHLAGWQKDLGQFYSGLSCYCQPSATEGFGIEVIESLSHGRMALCSRAAGAQDIVKPEWRFESCNVDALAQIIDSVKKNGKGFWETEGLWGAEDAKKYSWEKIRGMYKSVWEEVLYGK